MISFSNQIRSLVSKYLPYTSVEIGAKYQPSVVDDTTPGEIIMTFASGDYDIIYDIINDPTRPNSTFVMSGFKTKNEVLDFTAYPEDDSYKYGVVIKFKLPHKLEQGEEFTLKSFTNTTYNTAYTAYKVINSLHVLAFIVDTLIPNISITTGLGFLPVQYTEGLNGTKVVTDEGSNMISFEYDEDLLLSGEIDGDYLPYLHNNKDNVLAINKATFFGNLNDPGNERYLIIDTASLIGSPIRSNSNKSDAAYNTYNRSGRFDKSYTINLYYVLERYQDDASNQTVSGSDIDQIQLEMYEALTSILRQPLQNEKSIMSAATILGDKVDENISEGRVVIIYPLTFVSCYQNEVLLNIDDAGIYPINTLKINNDEIDLTKL